MSPVYIELAKSDVHNWIDFLTNGARCPCKASQMTPQFVSFKLSSHLQYSIFSDDLVAVGGYDNNTKQFLSSCERFSLKSEQWSAFPKLKVARRSPGVVSYKGQVGHLGLCSTNDG